MKYLMLVLTFFLLAPFSWGFSGKVLVQCSLKDRYEGELSLPLSFDEWSFECKKEGEEWVATLRPSYPVWITVNDQHFKMVEDRVWYRTADAWQSCESIKRDKFKTFVADREYTGMALANEYGYRVGLLLRLGSGSNDTLVLPTALIDNVVSTYQVSCLILPKN